MTKKIARPPLIASGAPFKKWESILLLDNIRSVHNVGSIFRTAETVGISKIYCAGITPAPLDRFNCKRRDLAKVALGSEELILWKYVADADTIGLIKKLKKDGFKIIALEQARNSIDYKNVKVEDEAKILIVLGNEIEGVSPEILKLTDQIAEIPVKGKKESLNVSVASGIFLYRLLDK